MDGNWEHALATAEREPLENLPEAYSGASLERVELPDGRRYVLKHLAPAGDWLTRATSGAGRIWQLWESGVLDRITGAVDHTIVDVLAINGHDAILMRDASDDLFPAQDPVPRAASNRALAGLAGMHDAAVGAQLDTGCSVGARYAMFAPAAHAADRANDAPGTHPVHELIVNGWSVFADEVGADLVDVVFGVHDDTAILDHAVKGCETTLIHGDVKLPNLGLTPDGRLVAIDWADITGVGPREVDVAWYALMGTHQIGGSPADVFDDYEAARGQPFDPVALDVASVGSLAQMGFRFAFGSRNGPAESRAFEQGLLDFWCDRARDALDRLSL